MAEEYRIWVNSRSVRLAHMSSSFLGTALSSTKLSWKSLCKCAQAEARMNESTRENVDTQKDDSVRKPSMLVVKTCRGVHW